MRHNLDTVDRIIRGVVGIWLIMVAFTALRVRRRTTAAIVGIAGIGLLQNTVTGFCGFNGLLGLDSTEERCDDC
ncbi:YgaP family membrane protein [Haloarcula nitratireducens]|uniref:DUF2892 domain-containing protein n=1 Tax=Haloarcula nitratireducens TaxID=2487749 RepID=A0AAW4PFN9_9EURY|nr:DUF2892 domain-containing protein [Halomicroarcula nitratireducens]MBX0296654.1 DUF2892 domain-containing protein [Halomicroarcula nitratireducens]